MGPLAAMAAAPPARWMPSTEIGFRHLTQEQGLPNEIATSVAEDGQGFVWVATLGGLARWDGYRFRTYKADSRSRGALPDNYLQALHGDASGRLWVGSNSAGLARYDPHEDRFVSYPVGADGLAHVSVRAMADDGRGGLWVATEGGLDHLDPASGRITRTLAADAQPEVGAGAGVHALLQDRRGRLWVGTPRGLFRRDTPLGPFNPIPLGAGAGVAPDPQSLAEDGQGRVWVGTRQGGAFVIDASGAAARPVHDSTARSESALIQGVIAIVEAQPGEMWLGTITQGIVAVDTATGATRRIRNLSTWSMSLSDNALRGLHRDRSGLVWVATNRGVNTHDPRQSAVLTRFGATSDDESGARSGSQVSWILPMPGGHIWLGTHKNGVEIVDPVAGQVGGLRPDETRPESALPQDIVLGLERVADGSVFIATKRGLYRASADGRQVRRVTLAGRDPAASTWALLADGATLWIGGQSDGLWKLDLASGRAEALLRDPAASLSDQRIMVMAHGPGGILWIGTRHGLNRYHPRTGQLVRIVPDPSRPDSLNAGLVTALYTDRQSRLWVGTYGGGINLLDPAAAIERARFDPIGTAQGLPDDSVNALIEDAGGRVWASTDNGLATIDPATRAVSTLRRAEGVVLPTYWTGSAARTEQGEMLFGGNGGMTIVRPDRLREWTWRPPVVVTELVVGGQRLPAARLAAPGAEPLRVTAEANSLSVEFAALDYSAPELNRYAYRLEGFDPVWVEADTSHRRATYTNLPPGSYRLLLRGSNRNGQWTEAALPLPIHVLPAWHQTLWFRAAALLAAMIAVYAVVQARTRLLRARQRELESKVRERTAELEAVTEALRQKSRVLERSSITDPLTGLHNRRFLTEHIDNELAGSLRRAQDSHLVGQPVDTDSVFLLIDVDLFKRVNDQHGHAAGDAVLVEFGRRLKATLRESDYLVRWGGEEFLAVACQTDRARADELAERLRMVISGTPFMLDGGAHLAITCSIGYACLPFLPSHPQALAWADVIKLADLALMAAKRVGRNTWVGLLATSLARAEGMPGRLQALPAQAVARGEIRIASNHASGEVLQALAGTEKPPVAP